jgi:Cu-Zn family superoxide dismutase
MRQAILSFVVACGLFAGCSEDEASLVTAVAPIMGKGASMALGGTALFEGVSGGVRVTINVTNAPPGKHGVHIHEGSSCADNDAGAAGAAGAHFNPDMKMHGEPGSKSHVGDLGNIEIGDNGRGELKLTTKRLQIGEGTNNVVRKAVVIHAMEDDEMTQPSGDSGGRIGCGVIQ